MLLQAALLYGAQEDALPVLSHFAHMCPQETLTYPYPDKLWPIPVRHNAPVLSPQSESVPLSDPSPQPTFPPSSVRQELVPRCVSKKQETHLTTLWVVPLGLEGSSPRKVGTQQWQSPIVISSQNPHTPFHLLHLVRLPFKPFLNSAHGGSGIYIPVAHITSW